MKVFVIRITVVGRAPYAYPMLAPCVMDAMLDALDQLNAHIVCNPRLRGAKIAAGPYEERSAWLH
ncbi:hypothetical protein [Burkholderia cenocepacia]|uniref:hypothetical protein n=1 Tax=Burkholderia cenocepacia TaxID=95486 RepID=UPI001B98D80A|nr:hypothetical protein [Burkholderia cenocepacia]MBR8137217.1 hypothetical protein [Burkholderia cenocepacia]